MSASQQAPVGEVCCVFTDIIDSTNLWEYSQKAMRVALTLHDKIIRDELAHFDGYEVKTLGDGFLATFSHPESALQFCLAAQKKLKAAQWPKEVVEYALQTSCWNGHSDYFQARGLRIRIGVNFGAPFSCSVNHLTGRMDYYGCMVNVASRMQAEAEEDEIALTDNFITELHRCRTGEIIPIDNLTHQIRAGITHPEFSEFRVRSKGLRPLKGLNNPEHVFLIVLRR